MVIASGCGPEDRGFDPRRSPQFFTCIAPGHAAPDRVAQLPHEPASPRSGSASDGDGLATHTWGAPSCSGRLTPKAREHPASLIPKVVGRVWVGEPKGDFAISSPIWSCRAPDGAHLCPGSLAVVRQTSKGMQNRLVVRDDRNHESIVWIRVCCHSSAEPSFASVVGASAHRPSRAGAGVSRSRRSLLSSSRSLRQSTMVRQAKAPKGQPFSWHEALARVSLQ